MFLYVVIVQLADSGKTMVQEGVQKYVPVSQLKYYFAVDTKYVLSKLGLLFFPFVHKVSFSRRRPLCPICFVTVRRIGH